MKEKIVTYLLLCSVIFSFVIVVTPTAEAGELTQKWAKTTAQIGIVGEADPVMCDVNGDGYKEIFLAGKPYDNRGDAYAHMVCIDGLNGTKLWDTPFLQYWGEGNIMQHLPAMVYDFDKDGDYEVICSGGSNCFNAVTGIIEWSKTTDYFGWHNNAFIDNGDYVTLYTCGGGYLRRVNAATGAVINQVDIGDSLSVCWGGIGIADMNHDGSWDIVVGTRGWSPYEGLMLFNEDLSIRIWNIVFTCSSQSPRIYDVDSDGMDEIIIAKQAGTSSQVAIVNYDGTYELLGPFANLDVHVAGTVGDCDGDGHMEWLSSDSTPTVVIDLVTKQLEDTLTAMSFCPFPIADVLTYPGYEIIFAEGNADQRGVYRYTGSGYVLAETLPYDMLYGVVADVDNDGLNEIVMNGGLSGGMTVLETAVPTSSPEPITQIAFGGMRRLNNGMYYPLPGTEGGPEPLYCDAHGPYSGQVNHAISFTGSATGGTSPYTWSWDFGDGNTSFEQNPTHSYNTKGNYTVILSVTDAEDITIHDQTWALITGDNTAPDAPVINGTIKGKPRIEMNFTVMTTDPNGDKVFYYIDWGDETNNSWIGPYASGDILTVSHIWSKKGMFIVRCKAKDVFGAESDWGTLQVNITGLTIEIKIGGGYGVSAIIQNTGTIELTDIPWSITLDGSMIFFGQTKSGTIPSLAPGESITVRDLFIIGIGETGIAVEAGDAKANATGITLLFFVLGVT
jgi:hypothetical protein